MSLRIRYSTGARTDFSAILRFSRQRWGRHQSRAYRQTLRKTISILAEEPGIGVSRDEIAPGMKSHPTGSHVVYYLPLDKELLIVRVLHSRQDPALEEW